MKCPKCVGWMCVEEYGDHFLTFQAGRCLNCGAIVDQAILSNKGIPPEPVPSVTIKQF